MSVIAFTGGGSGGHVLPGIAVIQAVQERGDHSLVWIGSRNGIERSIVSRMAPGVRYIAVPTGKLRRYLSIRNVVDMFKLPFGVMASLFRLFRLHPEVLFSKGGFVSVPPVIAAWILRIPVITHDSDADPGLATRINARFARYVCVPYSQSASSFSPRLLSRVRVTGNPVRREITAGDSTLGERYLGISGRRHVVFVLGGSIGSGAINALIDEGLERLCEIATVVHHRGAGNPPPARHPSYHPAAFFEEEFSHILARADLVISRAGAGTVWELAASGTPAILIPLGSSSSRGDQFGNAELYAESGAALVRSEETLTPDDLLDLVSSLLDDEKRLNDMSRAAASFAAAGAVDRIVDLIDSLRAEAVR